MGATFGIEIEGLEEVQKLTSKSRIKKVVKQSLGLAITQFHSELRTYVQNRYAKNINLDSYRIGKSSSVVTVGGNTLQGGLSYKIKYFDLSKFPFHVTLGGSGGRVHNVEVIKGRNKVSHGQYGQGGFVPIKSGVGMRFGTHGFQMFERTTSKRKPLKLIVAPSTGSMINFAIHNSPVVSRALDNLSTKIGELFVRV